uniref:NADH-ubiquinone oxidoreductase chain 2 n=1 Tax=Funkikonia zheana TaxID=3133676 RepID=A0AAU6PC07_9HEMI
MLMNSSKLLFLSFMIVGVMISFSSNSWVMVWTGMELFLLSFIPFFCNFSFLSSECAMSYFLIQGVSSSLFGFCMIFMLVTDYEFLKSFLCFSLLLKLGCAPFHSWIFGVVSGMSFNSLMIFLTFSSLPPFFLLSHISFNLNFFVLLNLVVGSVGGLNQCSLKKILGFSSIFNLGFLIYLLNLTSLWLIYFIFYLFMVSFVLMFLYLYCIEYLNHLFVSGLSMFSKISFWILFLSLGGMPPMFGFFVKLICIEYSIYNFDYFISFFMVIFSLVVIFFYIRCSFVSLFMGSYLLKWNIYLSFFFFNFFCLISSFIFPFCFVVKGLI